MLIRDECRWDGGSLYLLVRGFNTHHMLTNDPFKFRIGLEMYYKLKVINRIETNLVIIMPN